MTSVSDKCLQMFATASTATLIALTLGLASTGQAADNLIVNGGFETGDTTGWTYTAAASGGEIRFSSDARVTPHTGSQAVGFGATGSYDDTISQILTTTGGKTYNVDFWLKQTASSGSGDFKVYWNSTLLYSASTMTPFSYTEHEYAVTGTGSDTISFAGRNYQLFYILDDVSVVAVPEPQGLVNLSILGFGAVCLLRKRLFHKQ